MVAPPLTAIRAASVGGGVPVSAAQFSCAKMAAISELSTSLDMSTARVVPVPSSFWGVLLMAMRVCSEG